MRMLVLEGEGRRGVPAGVHGRVRTVHAAGEGDDEIVEQCRRVVGAGAEVSVATADRGLLARLDGPEGPDGQDGRGVAVVGPRSVREEKTDG